MKKNRNPIIANGELYVEPITKRSSPSNKIYPHEYSEAKEALLEDLTQISNSISENTSDEVFISDKIICFRLEPKFEAKSYVPNSIVYASKDMEIVGGRQYKIDEDTNAKLYFVKTSTNGINELYNVVKSGTNENNETWKNQVCSLRTVDLLHPDEKVLGFESTWTEGCVEIVLHPMGKDSFEGLDAFFNKFGVSRENVKYKVYDNGLTFISTKCDKNLLKEISHFNILRTIHPLRNIHIDPLRSDIKLFAVPAIEDTGEKPLIKVGVFDGGVNEKHPMLEKYVNSIDASQVVSDDDCVNHGTAVCGIILHGKISEINPILPAPCVSIDSYRVLPLLDTTDLELYEIIDLIENVVPNNKETKLYNLSLGPQGAILDDCISRFTYALDRLTYESKDDEINPLFCVAAGNDGALAEPLNRIQAPSDMVNGISVGAYSYTSLGTKIRANYSCVGEGREGAKVKPDILEFGGDATHPIIVACNNQLGLAGGVGTSYSSPLVVHKIGQLMARSQNITPHMGRTLLIHFSEYNSDIPMKEQGFGFCLDDVEDILNCDENDVTILYTGNLIPSQTVKLPIFSPNINSVSGNVEITWTIATIVDPCINDVDAYTNNCIEDVFYPHENTFNFTKDGSTKRINLSIDENVIRAKELESQGYKKSLMPASKSAKRFSSEAELRNNDFKWDTIIRKTQTARGTSLFNPFLTLHAMDRNDFEDSTMKYFVAIRIKAKNYKGSLYDSILQEYTNLSPIEIRNISRARYVQ